VTTTKRNRSHRLRRSSLCRWPRGADTCATLCLMRLRAATSCCWKTTASN
jgi:hypothetical protein